MEFEKKQMEAMEKAMASGQAPKADKSEDKKDDGMNAFAVSESKSVPKQEVKAEEPK